MQNQISTRDRLVEVAADRFWRQGFSATSLAQIANDADANGGSIYHFFRSKERLVLAVLDHFDAMLEGAIFEPALGKYSDPVDRIFGVLEVYRAFLEETECAMGGPIGVSIPQPRRRLPSQLGSDHLLTVEAGHRLEHRHRLR